jgi:hypothetical protein
VANWNVDFGLVLATLGAEMATLEAKVAKFGVRVANLASKSMCVKELLWEEISG